MHSALCVPQPVCTDYTLVVKVLGWHKQTDLGSSLLPFNSFPLPTSKAEVSVDTLPSTRSPNAWDFYPVRTFGVDTDLDHLLHRVGTGSATDTPHPFSLPSTRLGFRSRYSLWGGH